LLWIIILILATRIPLKSEFLWHWDSGNFALAIENYDIALDQPHPPGYIHYVGLGKLLNYFLHDANLSFVTLNIVFNLLAAFFVYKIALELFSETVAMMSTVLLIFNPFVWFNSLVAVSYMGDAFYNTAIAYFLCRLIKTRSNKYLYWAAMVLGLSGGLRQSTIVFMTPLLLFALYQAKTGIKANAIALLLCGASALTWLIPLIYTCGGYSEYLNLLGGQVTKFGGQTSVLFGATFSEHNAVFWQLIKWTLVGSGFAILYFLMYVFKHKKKALDQARTNAKSCFFLLWMCPSCLFYLLVHLGEPGYVLTFVPATQILLGYLIVALSRKMTPQNTFEPSPRHAALLFSFPLIFYVTYFLRFDPDSETVKKINSVPVLNKFFSKIDTIVQYHTIKKADALTRYYLDVIPKLTDDAKQLAIVVFDGSDWIWRIPMYYLPDYTAYRIATTYKEDFARFAIASRRRVFYPASRISIDNTVVVDFDSNKTRILWLLPAGFKHHDFFTKMADIKEVEATGQKLYITDVDPVMGCREFGNMLFNFNSCLDSQTVLTDYPE
jgi:hypothetical protein